MSLFIIKGLTPETANPKGTEIDKNEILSEREFYNFVFNEYDPSEYESGELKNPRFREGTYYAHLCKTRSFLVYREIARHTKKSEHILDIGFYPGTIIRQLKHFFGDSVKCYGIGLNVDEKFMEFMRPYTERCVDIELDPFYLKSDDEIHMPFENSQFDTIICTEILEHLISPLEMISESSRILRRGGKVIVTTPNVSHMGAILKLLAGESNYWPLKSSPMHLRKNKWRGHTRYYDKGELKELFSEQGMKMIQHRYYREKGWDSAKWSLLKRVAIKAVDKLCPVHRGEHFAVFEKI